MILTSEHIKQVLVTFFKDKPVNKVWLFGSYARGDADESSDLDVMVGLEKDAILGLEYFGWFSVLEQQFHKKVDLVKLGSIKPRIMPCVEKDLKLIYEKQ